MLEAADSEDVFSYINKIDNENFDAAQLYKDLRGGKASKATIDIVNQIDVERINNYIKDIIDSSGEINFDNMNELRLSLQKGTFSKEEISFISKKMSELNITNEFESFMKQKMNFKEFLKNYADPPPINKNKVHAHHILFKTGKGHEQQALVAEGQEILRKYGIDPVIGPENLVWAPMSVEGQHGPEILRELVNELKQADELGDYDFIKEILERYGEIASKRY